MNGRANWSSPKKSEINFTDYGELVLIYYKYKNKYKFGHALPKKTKQCILHTDQIVQH